MDFFFILLSTVVAAVLFLGGLGLSRLFAPHRPGGLKNTPYECGEKIVGSAWVQFNVGYYLFALLFLVFEVEAAFLYPWAVVFREVGGIGLLEVALFILVLIGGLIYAWRKGALEWV